MNRAYLLIGGNQGDRQNYLKMATEKIEPALGSISGRSALYETAPWGRTDQPAFLNQAIALDTPLSAPQLMGALLSIEGDIGRIRAEKFGPRIIDIDILFFNDEIMEEEGLVIPHPQFAYRRFALEPMNELAPGLLHPVLHKTMGALLEACTDNLDVKKLGPRI